MIIVKPDPLEMVFFNRDGSRAPMCGNGLRCFAKFCFDEGICTKTSYSVRTLAGPMGIKIVSTEPFLVKIDMGKPDFDPKQCGIQSAEDRFLKQKLRLKDGEVEVSSCFIGTIHTVVWVDRMEDIDLVGLGQEISNHPIYSEKTNVNFVQVMGRKTLRLVTYERGADMTLACGTGACASAAIGAVEDRCDMEVQVLLPYGQLRIEQAEDHTVFLTGPAVRIAQGFYGE